MSKKDDLYSGITNTILTEYFHQERNWNSVTLSEFRGVVNFGDIEYISVLNYTYSSTTLPYFILVDDFKKYIVSKRLSK